MKGAARRIFARVARLWIRSDLKEVERLARRLEEARTNGYHKLSELEIELAEANSYARRLRESLRTLDLVLSQGDNGRPKKIA